jgi:rRNA processing protein Gar1
VTVRFSPSNPLHDPFLAFPGVDLLQGIGHVLHLSAQGNIIARLNQATQLGTRVFSSNSKLVGRVIDIFGPTIQPFAAVKPETKITDTVIPPGTTLFMKKVPKGGVAKRRKK